MSGPAVAFLRATAPGQRAAVRVRRRHPGPTQPPAAARHRPPARGGQCGGHRARRPAGGDVRCRPRGSDGGDAGPGDLRAGGPRIQPGRVREGLRPVHARLRAQPPRGMSCSPGPRPCGSGRPERRGDQAATGGSSRSAGHGRRTPPRPSRRSRRRSRKVTWRPTRGPAAGCPADRGAAVRAEATSPARTTSSPGGSSSPTGRASCSRGRRRCGRLGGRREQAIGLYKAYIALGDGARDAEADKFITELSTPESTGDLDKDIEVSRSIFEKGARLYEAGAYGHAYDAFTRSYELTERPVAAVLTRPGPAAGGRPPGTRRWRSTSGASTRANRREPRTRGPRSRRCRPRASPGSVAMSSAGRRRRAVRVVR